MKTNWPALGFGCLLLAGAAVGGSTRERASPLSKRPRARPRHGFDLRCRSRPDRAADDRAHQRDGRAALTRLRAWTRRRGLFWILPIRSLQVAKYKVPSEYRSGPGRAHGAAESRTNREL